WRCTDRAAGWGCGRRRAGTDPPRPPAAWASKRRPPPPTAEPARSIPGRGPPGPGPRATGGSGGGGPSPHRVASGGPASGLRAFLHENPAVQAPLGVPGLALGPEPPPLPVEAEEAERLPRGGAQEEGVLFFDGLHRGQGDGGRHLENLLGVE